MSHGTTIYPIFLPHSGCPFRCVYCNQLAVTSSSFIEPDAVDLGKFVSQRLAVLSKEALRRKTPSEIAFFGGTFTALPLGTLEFILREASNWVNKGAFDGIRFSTRPDKITPEICAILAGYPIRTVELGVQSLSDEVLYKSRRGYTPDTATNAAYLVRQFGWALGVQLMLGLPGDSALHFMSSIGGTILMKPEFVRIYPTLVLEGTDLAEWYKKGLYEALELRAAIEMIAPAYDALFHAGIPVARIGLHADPELMAPGKILAGPFHPAFGYLVRVQWWRKRVDELIERNERTLLGDAVVIRIPSRQMSEVGGPGRENIHYWRERWGLDRLLLQGESSFSPGQFEIRAHPMDE